ncbi:MAG: hypothetical protein E7186_07685 [Erysipelotrichaceae bacterium]|nr:hypothetical protein [Erysipelotrichaceae bacterium]
MKKMILLIAMAGLLVLCSCRYREEEKREKPILTGNQDTLTYPVGVNASIWVNYSEDPLLYESLLNCSNNKNGTLPVYRIDTAEQLQEFIDRFSEVLSLDDFRDSFVEFANGLDEAFFRDNSLLMAYHIASSGSFTYRLDKTEISGSELIMHIIQTNNPEIYTCDMAGWLEITDIRKSLLSEITEYDAVVAKPEQETARENYEVFEGEQYATLPGHLAWGSFSYEKDLRMRQELNWNIITEGFVNTEPTDEYIPVEQAKKELSEQYLLRQVFHDDMLDIWKIRFFNSEESSEETDVYIDSQGVTKLIVRI